MEWQKLIRGNERWLATYCALAKFIGWILVFFGVFDLAGGVYMKIFHPTLHTPGMFLEVVIVMPLARVLLPGMIALVVGAFLQYLLNPDARPGLLLTHGDKIFYFAAAIYLVRFGGMLTNMPAVYAQFDGFMDAMYKVAAVVIPEILRPFAQILIAVGLAQGLRRMLAAIQDSKTLV
ncbi:MAG: hypothetical protein ABFD69_05925 [Candidatus Sumerlaeia bacterium]